MGYWVIRTYEANGVVEKIKFFVQGSRPNKKISRRVRSEINKREQNEASAIKNLSRAINYNFGPEDLFVTLTYDVAGLQKILKGLPVKESEDERRESIWEKANHQMMLFIRRVKRECDKQGIELKYAGTTSDYDHKHDKTVRVHHHLIMSADALESIKGKWTLGNVHSFKLGVQDDYRYYAEYMLKQVRWVPDRKKYTPSRNLARPEPHDRIAVNDSELRVPKGAKILFRAEIRPQRPQYLRYFFPERRFKDYVKEPSERRQI
ncbi:MAG: hypothetical protein KBT02_10275 [Treponema sp.]|nr:hypothetical protein [Candidatus Treponema caballi]